MIPRRGWEKWRRGGTSRPRRKAISREKERREREREIKWRGGERRREWTIEEEERDRKGDCAGVKPTWDRPRQKERMGGMKGRMKRRLGTNHEKSRWDLNFSWICILSWYSARIIRTHLFTCLFRPAVRFKSLYCYSKLEVRVYVCITLEISRLTLL